MSSDKIIGEEGSEASEADRMQVAVSLGKAVSDNLKKQGAMEILQEIRHLADQGSSSSK